MSATDQLLKNNEAYAAAFDRGHLPRAPSRQTAILACMDARLDLFRILGLEAGDVHVIRNAGGVATDDAIRSLTISQRLLGTKEIILIHHTDCGLLTPVDDDLARQILDESGLKPRFARESLPDLDQDVKHSIARIKSSPLLPHTEHVRGFVYEVETGKLREIV